MRQLRLKEIVKPWLAPGESAEAVYRVSTGPPPMMEEYILIVPIVLGWFEASVLAVLIGAAAWIVTALLVGFWRTRYLLVPTANATHVLRCRRWGSRPVSMQATYERSLGAGMAIDRRRFSLAGTIYWMEMGTLGDFRRTVPALPLA